MEKERVYRPRIDWNPPKKISRNAQIRESRRRRAIKCAPILWTDHPLCRADKLDHKIKPIKVLGRLDNKCLVVQGLSGDGKCTAVKAVYVYAQPRSPYSKRSYLHNRNVFIASVYDFEYYSNHYPEGVEWSDL